MKSFKIRGERLLNAIDWMSRVQRDIRPNSMGALPDGHPALPLAVRFDMYGILTRIAPQLLWPDVRDLITQNPQLAVCELEMGALVESLDKRYRPNFVAALMTFLNAVACGEVTEGDLQT